MILFKGRELPHLEFEMRGGLGNQLFQLIGALSQANRLGGRLVINETALRKHSDFTRRNWLKQIVLDGVPGSTEIEWLTDKRILTFLKSKQPQILDENGINNVAKIDHRIRFRGWYQESKFPLELGIARKSLQPKSISIATQKHINYLGNNLNTCAIHMRFGDFLESSWGVISADWYKKAIYSLGDRNISEIHVYSDDIKTAEQIIDSIPHQFKVIFPEKELALLPHELLWVLRNYQTFISSNSTLSWWASYLNVTDNPTIYCKWEKHLFLEPWIKVN